MPIIRQLDPHVADLIAAGEVVERPASVVKELLENAIDAGASAVTVEIAHGGMTLIRVTDDGCGIPADQAPTAFLRHATSKISGEGDLEAIGTLGFRGEALAAISAVSRIELLTRTQDAAMGASLTVEAGTVVRREEAGCPLGTVMTVRELFFNTPARLKFMKKDAAEGAAVFAAVQRTALSHPELSVRFLRDGKQELLTPGDGQLKSAVYAVMGRDIALGFLPVKGGGEGMGVEGFASLPSCCRGSRSYQHFFVNGRYIRSRVMMAAVEEAYKNQKMVGRFPGCVIHLRLSPAEVDVNVHPAKTEVKFRREQSVFTAVYGAVRSALERDHSRPQAEVSAPVGSAPVGQTSLGRASAEQVPLGQVPVGQVPMGQAPVGQAPRQTGLTRREHTAPGGLPQWGLPLHDGAGGPKASPAKPIPREAPEKTERSAPVGSTPMGCASVRPAPVGPAPAEKPAVFRRVTPLPPEESVAQEPRTQEPVTQESPTQTSLTQEPPAPQEEPWIVRGELFHTYIIVEQGDKALLIDKHAAHERANFDRLRAEDYRPMVQELLTPVTFAPAPEEREVLLEQLPLLERFGFDVEEFGSRALAVRSAPDYLDAGEIEGALCELARRLRVTGTADPAAARDELLHTMACKAAIKGGWHSGPEELEEAARLVMSGQVKYCPHGRPVAVELTKKQLEKQFRRI